MPRGGHRQCTCVEDVAIAPALRSCPGSGSGHAVWRRLILTAWHCFAHPFRLTELLLRNCHRNWNAMIIKHKNIPLLHKLEKIANPLTIVFSQIRNGSNAVPIAYHQQPLTHHRKLCFCGVGADLRTMTGCMTCVSVTFCSRFRLHDCSVLLPRLVVDFTF